MKQVRNLKSTLTKRVRPALLAVILLFTMGFSGYTPKAEATEGPAQSNTSVISPDGKFILEKSAKLTADEGGRTFEITLNAKLNPAYVPPVHNAPRYVVIAVDRSLASTVKEQLKATCDAIKADNSQNKISVITFGGSTSEGKKGSNDNASVVQDFTDCDNAKTVIDGFYFPGEQGTNIEAAFKKIDDQLDHIDDTTIQQNVILITDTLPTSSNNRRYSLNSKDIVNFTKDAKDVFDSISDDVNFYTIGNYSQIEATQYGEYYSGWNDSGYKVYYDKSWVRYDYYTCKDTWEVLIKQKEIAKNFVTSTLKDDKAYFVDNNNAELNSSIEDAYKEILNKKPQQVSDDKVSASNVSLTDVISKNFTFVQNGYGSGKAFRIFGQEGAATTPTYSGQNVSWNVGNISSENGVTIKFKVKANEGVTGIVPTNDSATINYDGTSAQFGKPTVDLRKSELSFDKKASYNDETGKATITFNINGTPGQMPPSTADIVLLIDRSGSMSDGNKIDTVKKSAIDFCDTILRASTGDNVRISIASFAGRSGENAATENQSFTNDFNALKSTINNIQATGGTNTEAGIKKIDDIITSSTANQKYAVLFTDGEPTYYIGGGNGSDATSTCRDEAKVRYTTLMSREENKNLTFYSLGLFTGDSANSTAQDFLYSIQNVENNFDKYCRDYFTKDLAGISKAFTKISNDIAGKVSSTIASNVVIKDPITTTFTVPEGIEPRIEGTYDGVGLVKPITINSKGEQVLEFRLGNITSNSLTISFDIAAADEYYGGNGIRTNDGATINYKDPMTGEIKNGTFNDPEVDLPFTQGSISIEKKVFDEILNLDTKGNLINDKSKFSICLNRMDGKETYMVDLTGNATDNKNKTTMNFYLKGNNTDISPNDDITKNYVTAGTYSVKEIVPMDYENKNISVRYFDSKSGENGKWKVATDLNAIPINRYCNKIEIVVENNKVNNSYWRDRSDVSNTFKYTGK